MSRISEYVIAKQEAQGQDYTYDFDYDYKDYIKACKQAGMQPLTKGRYILATKAVPGE